MNQQLVGLLSLTQKNLGFIVVPVAIIMMVAVVGCGDVRLMREAAQNTSEMNKKMEDMLKEVEKSNETTTEVSGKMDDMLEEVEKSNQTTSEMKTAMERLESETMAEMHQKMDTIIDRMVSMEGLVKLMQSQMDDVNAMMTTMNSLVSNMEKLFGLTYKQGRQVAASFSRSLAIAALTDPNTKIEAKLTRAAIYYYSFEYQSLRAEELEDHSYTSLALYEGVREFLKDVTPLIKITGEDLTINHKTNNHNVLYALAAAMHEYNPLQEGESSDIITMEKLLKYGMLTHKLGLKDPPEFAAEIETWLPTAHYLLRLRHNFITGVIMQKISDLDQVAQYQSINWKENSNLATKFFRPWTIAYDQVLNNLSLMKEVVKFTHIASDLREFLYCYNDDGMRLQMAPGLVGIFQNLDLDDITSSGNFRTKVRLSVSDSKVAEDFISAMEALKASVTGESLSLDHCQSASEMLADLNIPYKGIE